MGYKSKQKRPSSLKQPNRISKKPYQMEIQDKGKKPHIIENPDKYYSLSPAWNFKSVDTECWAFTKSSIDESTLWDEIIDTLKSLETQTWNEILIGAKKKNHSIDVEELNKVARKRLDEKYIEAESVVSLRLMGTHRLYGFMVNQVFNILWFDDNHGDNDTCVCRSKKKHT